MVRVRMRVLHSVGQDKSVLAKGCGWHEASGQGSQCAPRSKCELHFKKRGCCERAHGKEMAGGKQQGGGEVPVAGCIGVG